MKPAKSIFLAVLSSIILLSGIPANSQTTGFSFGLRSGLNLQNINGKDLNGDHLSLNMVPRFHLGLVVAIPVATDFYFQPGLLFTTKGAKSQDQFLGIDMSVEYNISYIELPLNLLYKPELGNGHFLIGFGPYLAYGVGGKATFTIGSVSDKEDIVFTKDYVPASENDWKYFKNLDYGGNLFFGYELKSGISLQLNGQLGLAKINAERKNASTQAEFRNTGFGISLGFNF